MAIDKFRGQYNFLSNFSNSVITMPDGITYPSVEHAFQAYKSWSFKERERIAALKTPTEAKSAGRNIKDFREDWNTVRISVMYECLKRKFKDPVLANRLLSTNNEYLEEGNTWGDTFWGVCKGVGYNHLGKLLMKIRSELKVQKDINNK